jgi:hypothetical protein
MDIELLKKKKTFLEGYYNSLFGTYDALTSYYNLDFPIGKTPAAVEIYRPATPRKQVDTAVNHVMALGIDVDMQFWSEAKKTKELVTLFKKFGSGFIEWLIRRGKTNPLRSICKNAFLYGVGYSKGPLYIPRLRDPQQPDEIWKDYLSSSFPFYFRSVHPRNVMFDPSEYPQYVIETFDRTVSSIKSVWPDWNQGNKEDTETVSWWEYWSPTERQYFVEDEPLLNGDDAQNTYGFLPYELVYGGFGIEADDSNPDDLYVSLIAPALSAYKMEARSKTAIEYLFETNAYSKLTLNRQPGDDLVITTDPGEPDIIPSDYGAAVRDTAHVNPDMWRWLGMLQQDQERIVPSTVGGGMSKGITSGYMMGTAIGQARVEFDAVKKDLEKMLSNMLQKTLIMIKNVVQEPVGITGNFVPGGSVTIKPTDIDETVQHFTVAFDAEAPEDKDRRIALGIQLLSIPEQERGISTESIVMEYFGKDYGEELERILVNRSIQNPLVFEGLAVEALKQTGMKAALDLLQQGKLPSQNTAQPLQPGQGVNGEQPRTNDYTRSKQRLAPGTGEIGSAPEQQGAPQVPPYGGQ